MKFNVNILALLLIFTISFDAYACQQNDYIALRALYLSTDGNNWESQTDGNAEWPFKLDFMMHQTTPPPGYENLELWHGVGLDANGCVDYLGLSNNQLSGSIPSELGNLSNLIRLYLSSNQLSGIIPPEFGNLSNLTTLYLSSNQLSGPIPPELGDLSNLTRLHLYNNDLSGCYDPNLLNLCTQIINGVNSNISNGNLLYRWEDFCNSGAGQCGCNCEAYTTQDQSITGVNPNDLPNSTYRLDLDDSITPGYSGDGDESIFIGNASELTARLNALRLQHHIDCARECNKAILVSASDIGISHPFSASSSVSVSVSDFDQYVNSDQDCQNILNVGFHHRGNLDNAVGTCSVLDNHGGYGSTVAQHIQPNREANLIPILNFSNFYAQVDFTGTRLLVYEVDFRENHLAWLQDRGAIQINGTKDVSVLDEDLLSTLQATYAFPVILVHNVLGNTDSNCAGNTITNNIVIRNLEIIPRNNTGVNIDEYRRNAFTLDTPDSEGTFNFFGDQWYYPMPGMMLIFEAYRANAATGGSCNKCEHSGISNTFYINPTLENTVMNFENNAATDFTAAEHDLISQYAHIDNIRISHLSEGIHVYNAHNLVMNNLDLFNFSDASLAVNNSSGCYVLNSRVRYGSDGNCNFAWGICESHLVNCEISANGISGLGEDFRKGQCFNLEGDANRNYIIKNNIHTGYRGVYIKRGSDGNQVKNNLIQNVNRCIDISTTENQSATTFPNIGTIISGNTMSFDDVVSGRPGTNSGIVLSCDEETEIINNNWDGGTPKVPFIHLNLLSGCTEPILNISHDNPSFSTTITDNVQNGGGAFINSGIDNNTIDQLTVTNNWIINNTIDCSAVAKADIELCAGSNNDFATGGTLLSNSSITGNSRNTSPISASFTGEQFTDFNTGALGGVITNNVTTQLCPCFSPGHNINCLHTLNLSGTTSNSEPLFGNNNDYEAFNAIQSDQCVDSPHVIYDAGETINLLPGFKIPVTTDFEAIIDGCGGSQRNIEGQEDSLKENSDSNKD